MKLKSQKYIFNNFPLSGRQYVRMKHYLRSTLSSDVSNVVETKTYVKLVQFNLLESK